MFSLVASGVVAFQSVSGLRSFVQFYRGRCGMRVTASELYLEVKTSFRTYYENTQPVGWLGPPCPCSLYIRIRDLVSRH